MKRRNLIATTGICLSVSLAGCPLSDESRASDSDSISDRYNCTNARRPEPDVDAGIEQGSGDSSASKSVGSTEYPSPPRTSDKDSVKRFVWEFEQAFRQNELVAEHGERLTLYDGRHDETNVIGSRKGMTIIRIDYRETIAVYYQGEGDTVHTEGTSAAAYAVDETGAVRVETDHQVLLNEDESIEENTTDPLEDGHLTVCF